MQVAKKICHRLVLMQKGKIVETAHWPSVLKTTDSTIRQTLYGDSKAQLPEYIYNQLQETPSTHVILRVLFPGQEATIPFISQMCRQLNTHINILSAQIEHSHQQQCGMMLLSMETKDASLKTFLEHCEGQNIIGDIIGYVEHIKS
jgi:D-methionine transport system ATP-binding protein